MSKFLSFNLVFILLLTSVQTIFADQIFLKNGDRLTGKIVKKDGDKIVIQTDAAGEISLLWSAVEKIVSDAPLNIKLTDGQLIKGVAAAAADETKIEIETENAGRIVTEKENIELLRSVEEQARVEAEEERLRDPSLLELWKGTANVGFSLTSGNSETRALTAGVRANRETRKDKISVYANAVQASNSTSGVSETTAQAVWAGARYDYNLNRKIFVFGSADFEYDKPQLLDLRSVFGAGFGYKAIRSDKAKLDVFGGASYNRENFATGETRNSAEALFGNELNYKITSNVNLEQRFSIYPSVSRFGKFRSLFDASVVTDLNDWLGWQVTVGNRFNSNPVGNAEKNDFLFSTGLRATFGRKSKK